MRLLLLVEDDSASFVADEDMFKPTPSPKERLMEDVNAAGGEGARFMGSEL